jgi:hypothetical protein
MLSGSIVAVSYCTCENLPPGRHECQLGQAAREVTSPKRSPTELKVAGTAIRAPLKFTLPLHFLKLFYSSRTISSQSMYTIYYIKSYNCAMSLSGTFVIARNPAGKFYHTQCIALFMPLRKVCFVI